MNVFLLALMSILMSVAAQFSLKAGVTELRAGLLTGAPGILQSFIAFASNRFLILGFMLYGLGAIVWLSVLAKWDVSKAYPIVGLGFLMSAAVGFAMGEPVTLLRLFGVLLIVTGVLVVTMS